MLSAPAHIAPSSDITLATGVAAVAVVRALDPGRGGQVGQFGQFGTLGETDQRQQPCIGDQIRLIEVDTLGLLPAV